MKNKKYVNMTQELYHNWNGALCDVTKKSIPEVVGFLEPSSHESYKYMYKTPVSMTRSTSKFI